MGAGSEADAETTMRVLHRAVIFQRLHNLRHRRALLADSDINADQSPPF